MCIHMCTYVFVKFHAFMTCAYQFILYDLNVTYGISASILHAVYDCFSYFISSFSCIVYSFILSFETWSSNNAGINMPHCQWALDR